MTVGEYLQAAVSLPWEWGVHDCTAWPARWADIELPGYASDAEARAMIEGAGGLVSLWEGRLAGRLPELLPGVPFIPGDVGIIEASNAMKMPVEVGAIYTGKRWAFVPVQGGVAAMHAEPIRAWRPLCHRP